jgi:hypothetical protein
MKALESSVSFWGALSFWLITAGVILAFFGGVASIMFRRYNHQLAVLTEVHNREERAANDKAIADAGARAAEANARAAEANLEVAKLREPRSLTPKQQEHLASVMKPFAGQTFSMSVQGDFESIQFLRTLKSILASAGWVQIPSQLGDIQIEGAGQIFETGVIVEVTPKAEMKRADIAALFVNELNTMGISARGLRDFNLKDDSALNIAVGKKP